VKRTELIFPRIPKLPLPPPPVVLSCRDHPQPDANSLPGRFGRNAL